MLFLVMHLVSSIWSADCRFARSFTTSLKSRGSTISSSRNWSRLDCFVASLLAMTVWGSAPYSASAENSGKPDQVSRYISPCATDCTTFGQRATMQVPRGWRTEG